MLKPPAPTREASDTANLVQILQLQAEINRLELPEAGQSEAMKLIITTDINQRRAAQSILYQRICPAENANHFDDSARGKLVTRLKKLSTDLKKTKEIEPNGSGKGEDLLRDAAELKKLLDGIKLLSMK
jgi:hypothetical protein